VTAATRAHRVALPSGADVRVRVSTGALAGDDRLDGEPHLFGRAVRALLAPGAIERRDLDGTWAALARDAVLDLSMRDFHALRDLLLRTGAVAPEPDEGACRNCDAALAFDPRTLDPTELATRHAGAAPPPDGPVALPAPIRLPRGAIAREATLEPVTLGEALPLLRALARDEPFRITPRLLAAMGVRALGPLDRPVLLARALSRASDETWAAIERRYLELNSPPPVIAPLSCPACGALHEIEVPTPRELDPDATAREHVDDHDGATFPDPEAFEALVERIAPAVYEARAVRNIALRVETGVPDTDIAGEPLLGCYEPRQHVDYAGHTEVEFLVTLYYETFRRMWRDDGPYDLEAELRETIDHELEHHLHHLAGHDPMDAAERAEARRELRALYGDRRLARMAAGEAAGDLRSFARATWPFFALIAAGLAVAAAAGWISL
jgi:hypothetical protein